MITCPKCSEISKDNVEIYYDKLRQQNITISPILATCKICGSEIVISHTCSAGKIIVLNGTCGSGKTTIAEHLQSKGYLAIDGDGAIQSIRYKKASKKYEWGELIDEIIREIDILSLFGEKIVLSHMIMPEDLQKYIDLFDLRGLKYKFVLLKPEYQSAVKRCQTRTCHNNTTPEVWVKHFYDTLIFDATDMYIVDNTNQTVEETVDTILQLPYHHC